MFHDLSISKQAYEIIYMLFALLPRRLCMFSLSGKSNPAFYQLELHITVILFAKRLMRSNEHHMHYVVRIISLYLLYFSSRNHQYVYQTIELQYLIFKRGIKETYEVIERLPLLQ